MFKHISRIFSYSLFQKKNFIALANAVTFLLKIRVISPLSPHTTTLTIRPPRLSLLGALSAVGIINRVHYCERITIQSAAADYYKERRAIITQSAPSALYTSAKSAILL